MTSTGVIVSLFVLWAGIGGLTNTSSSLLGQPPEPDTVKMIEEKILSYDGVYGVHDLIVHDYGPGRCFVTAHAEVSSDTDIMASHDLMDVIEQDFKRDTAYSLTLHMDPIVMDDEKTNAAKEMVTQIISEIDPSLSFHDFRMVSGPHHTNLIFDIEIPFEEKRGNKEILALVEAEIKKIDKTYFVVINVDRV